MNPFRAMRFFGLTVRTAFRPAASSRAWQPTHRPPVQRSIQASFFSRSRHRARTSRISWQTHFRQARSRQQQQTRGYRQQMFNRNNVLATGMLFRRWVQRPTFYYEVSGLAGLCGVFYIYNLETVPVSGRRRFNVLSPEAEASLAQSTLNELLHEYGGRILPETSKEHRMALRVMERLIPHCGLADQQWELRVIHDDAEKNAFVLPGGKVFLFTGMLEFCKNEDGLAAVLGHEIAHNVAHHAGEQTSRFFILYGIGLLAWFAGGIDPGIWRVISNLAFSLPGSRKQEEEADYIGLLMMAESCYDPKAALRLWASMEKAEQGREPPSIMSTHPSHHTRLEKIQSWLGEANDKREMSDCAATNWRMDRFREVAEFPR